MWRRNPAAVSATKIHHDYELQSSNPEKRKNRLGGRRNLLKKLISDKEIEENPRKFL
jgi:hypothetical protein